MKPFKFAIIMLLSLGLFACKTTSLLNLDDSPITVTAANKDVTETRSKLLLVMQSAGYKIEDADGDLMSFRRAQKGLLGILAGSERLQQEDLVNCLLVSEGNGTLVNCRAYLESVNRKGHNKRAEKTQAVGYRNKLTAELDRVND